MFTGILAAEERVKNAGMPLSRKQINTKGYGSRRIFHHTINGLNTNATKPMQPSSTKIKCPYSCAMRLKPVSSTVTATKPMMPSGANLITPRTIIETALAKSPMMVWVTSLALRSAKPSINAHAKMPM